MGKFLKTFYLICLGIESNYFGIEDKILYFFIQGDVFLDHVSDIGICLSHVFEISTVNSNFAVFIMHLTPQAIVFILAGEFHVLKTGQNLLN